MSNISGGILFGIPKFSPITNLVDIPLHIESSSSSKAILLKIIIFHIIAQQKRSLRGRANIKKEIEYGAWDHLPKPT